MLSHARILRPLVVAALVQTVLISRPLADEDATEALDSERTRARGATSSSPIAVSPESEAGQFGAAWITLKVLSPKSMTPVRWEEDGLAATA